jgi:hypothetical protein
MVKTRLALCTLLVCIASTIALGQQVSVNYNHSRELTLSMGIYCCEVPKQRSSTELRFASFRTR